MVHVVRNREATTTAPSPKAKGSAGRLRKPIATAAARIKKGEDDGNATKRGDPARPEVRQCLQQPRLRRAQASATAPSPTTTRRSGSTRATPTPTTAATCVLGQGRSRPRHRRLRRRDRARFENADAFAGRADAHFARRDYDRAIADYRNGAYKVKNSWEREKTQEGVTIELIWNAAVRSLPDNLGASLTFAQPTGERARLGRSVFLHR